MHRLLASAVRLPFIGRIIASPVLEVPDFRRHCAGVAFNSMGSGGEQVLFGLLIFQLTASSVWVGFSLALYYGPMMVVGVAGGAVADWADRRTLLRRVEIALVVLFSLYGTLIGRGGIEPWHLLLMVLGAGCVRALHQPARASYAFDLVGADKIVPGLGLLNVGQRLGQLIGALLAGSAMQRLGPDVAYYLLALAHLAGFLVFSRLQFAGANAVTDPVSLATNVREYIAELRNNRNLSVLIGVTITVEIFGFSFATALPELATQRLGVGAEGLGVMQATRAAGGLMAGVFLAGASGLDRRGLYLVTAIYGFGAGLCLLAVAPSFLLAVGAIMLIAFAATSVDIFTQSMMQLAVPNALRGRAMGAWVFAAGTGPVGHLQMGALATSLGAGLALGVNGAALVLVGVIITVALPGLRRS